MATVTSYYARAATLGAVRQGLSVDGLYAQAGIQGDLVILPQYRVPTRQMTQLIRSIWRELKDEFMGFTARPCKPGSFAMMLQLVSRCDSLDEVFEQGIRFYHLLTDDIRMTYVKGRESRQFIVEMANPELDPQRFYLEFWLVIWHRFSSWLIGQPISLDGASFSYPEPQHVSEFRLQFRCPFRFDANCNGLSFSARYAAVRPMRNAQEIRDFLTRSPQDLLVLPGPDLSLTRQVRDQLLSGKGTDNITLDSVAVAARLNISQASLRRRLAREGTSFQQIKDALRRDIAIEQLSVKQMKVSDVAELLGYSESRAFTRAFQQWTGVSPGTYKQKADH